MAKLFTLFLCISIFSFLLAASSLAEEQALRKRQDDQTSDDATITTVSSPGRTSTTIVTSTASRQSTTRASTSQPSPTTTSRQTTQETSTGPTTTRSPPGTTSQGDKPGETTTGPNSDSTSDSDSTVSMTTLSPTTRRQFTTIYSTITTGTSTGQVSSIVLTSITVETPIVPVSGSRNQGQGSGGGNIKPVTRNTIIGAVVGVGGALLVGGLVIFAWRLKRRRVNPVDEDDLMRRDGSPLAAGRDMRTTSPEESPFKATLDQYHKPPGTVNASSNF